MKNAGEDQLFKMIGWGKAGEALSSLHNPTSSNHSISQTTSFYPLLKMQVKRASIMGPEQWYIPGRFPSGTQFIALLSQAHRMCNDASRHLLPKRITFKSNASRSLSPQMYTYNTAKMARKCINRWALNANWT